MANLDCWNPIPCTKALCTISAGVAFPRPFLLCTCFVVWNMIYWWQYREGESEWESEGMRELPKSVWQREKQTERECAPPMRATLYCFSWALASLPDTSCSYFGLAQATVQQRVMGWDGCIPEGERGRGAKGMEWGPLSASLVQGVSWKRQKRTSLRRRSIPPTPVEKLHILLEPRLQRSSAFRWESTAT